MDVVFKNDELKAHYLKYGFATVENFLDGAELDVILQGVQEYDSALAGVPAFSTSTDNSSSGFRIAMRELINRTVHPGKTSAYFEGYTPFYSNLLIKKPAVHSEMVLHTDWSITDETKYIPLQIWIPLVDVSRANGTLAVVPGSHHLTNVYRGCRVEEPYMRFENELLKDHLHFFEVKKGTAVFYHPGILHYSPSNLSQQTRLAILVSYYPTAMKPVLYYQNRFNFFRPVSVYELTPDFFDTWDKTSKPRSLKKINAVHQPRSFYNKTEFLSKLACYRYEESVSG